MTNAYVLDQDSIKLPPELSAQLKLKQGMELKVISDAEEGIILLKIIQTTKKDFMELQGVGKEIWADDDAQDYVHQERSQ